MLTCPICRAAMPPDREVGVEWLSETALTPTQRVLVGELVRRHPRPVARSHLVGVIWPSEADRPPNPGQQLSVNLSFARTALRAVGWTITKSEHGAGLDGRHGLARLP